jgi:hypothetical protein
MLFLFPPFCAIVSALFIALCRPLAAMACAPAPFDTTSTSQAQPDFLKDKNT